MRLNDIKKLQIKLSPVFKQYIGDKMKEEQVDDFFKKTINIYLPKASEESKYCAWSFYKLLKNRKIDEETLLSLSSMLVYFKPEIKAGIFPKLWPGDETKATMLCLGVSPSQAQNKKRMLDVYLMCISGWPAGLYFQVTLSGNLLEYILGKKLGVSYKKYNAVAEEIAGCIFNCTVSEDTSKSYLSNYTATPAIKKHNIRLAEARNSFTKCKTPLMPCSSCKKRRNECNKAVWR